MKKTMIALVAVGALALSACGEYTVPINNIPNTYAVGDKDGSFDYEHVFDACVGHGNVKSVQTVRNDDDPYAIVTCTG